MRLLEATPATGLSFRPPCFRRFRRHSFPLQLGHSRHTLFATSAAERNSCGVLFFFNCHALSIHAKRFGCQLRGAVLFLSVDVGRCLPQKPFSELGSKLHVRLVSAKAARGISESGRGLALPAQNSHAKLDLYPVLSPYREKGVTTPRFEMHDGVPCHVAAADYRAIHHISRARAPPRA